MHTCKSLWNFVRSCYPEIEFYLPRVREYCQDADSQLHDYQYNRSFNSLKWAVYGLRECLHPKLLETMFGTLLMEAAMTGREDDLFNNVSSFKAFEPYESLIVTPVLSGETKELANGKRLYVDRRVADVIVFRNSKGHAVIIFRERDKSGKSTGVPDLFNSQGDDGACRG